ncbi:hypothetical protein SAY87_002036 [Trapa incisa]|uniref:MAPK kinase substrate protein n=1 Tax=Trapa incisa TaxID=236973 RepID=A0AAN7PTD5_9MYRT|nr:hypothetical protein SAY87_002036 [Trapa incisa]
MAAILQRSVTSFRRQGSSGLVWDERFFTGEVQLVVSKPPVEEHDNACPKRTAALSRQSNSDGSPRMTRYPARVEGPRITAKPPLAPPSPKNIGGGCGFCGILGRPVGKNIDQTARSTSSNKSKNS